jgi:hypothetical protein
VAKLLLSLAAAKEEGAALQVQLQRLPENVLSQVVGMFAQGFLSP